MRACRRRTRARVLPSVMVVVCVVCGVLGAPAAESAAAADAVMLEETVAERLYRGFRELDTVACEIQRVTRTGSRMTRLLSRVYYQRPHRIHVENASPSPRRILADGTRLYYHEQGNPRGFSQLVAVLSGDWLAAVENVPATPTEHLRMLLGIAQLELPPGPEGESRYGYRVNDLFVVLALDRPYRLTGITFYDSESMANRTASYVYDAFEQVHDACWIPLRQRGVIYLPDGTTIEETRRITNLSVNAPIAPALFNPAGFFEGVEFVDSYQATLPR